MSKNSKRDLAASQRGLIVQRVIVGGWSPAQAGAPYGIGERQVLRWVAAYRTQGMGSLRADGAADRRLIRRLVQWFGRFGRQLCGRSDEVAARRIVLRCGDEFGTAKGPARRTRWN